MTPTEILVNVAAETGVTVKYMMSANRHKSIVVARRLAARRLRDAGLSLVEIGRWLGGRHHTSVLYYLREPDKPTDS